MRPAAAIMDVRPVHVSGAAIETVRRGKGGIGMPTFVLMTRLSTEVYRHIDQRGKIGREWKEDVDRKCPGVSWIGHYALLGPYDFMDIFEAPDAETAARVSLISRARGAVKAESWTAIPYTSFVKIAEDVG
jgi:uncharacterized protein with GYD domain